MATEEKTGHHSLNDWRSDTNRLLIGFPHNLIQKHASPSNEVEQNVVLKSVQNFNRVSDPPTGWNHSLKLKKNLWVCTHHTLRKWLQMHSRLCTAKFNNKITDFINLANAHNLIVHAFVGVFLSDAKFMGGELTVVRISLEPFLSVLRTVWTNGGKTA